MVFYVYKITNLLNDKWYIGKRKHNSPEHDPYMGSGRLIKDAIIKYGRENFKKEILASFDSDFDAAEYEYSLVNKNTLSRDVSYNLHEGGRGGFAHTNDGSSEHIKRCKKGAENSSGKYHENWGRGRWKSGTEQPKLAAELANRDRKGKPISDTHRQKLKEYAAHHNWMTGKKWYAHINDVSFTHKQPYTPGEEPEDWFELSEFKTSKKSGSFGYMWISNPISKENRYIKKSLTLPEGWVKGRYQKEKH